MRTFGRLCHILTAIKYDYLASQFLIDTELPRAFFLFKAKTFGYSLLNRYYANMHMQYIRTNKFQSQCLNAWGDQCNYSCKGSVRSRTIKGVNVQEKTVQFIGVNLSGTSSTRSLTRCTRRSRHPPSPTTKAKPTTMKKKTFFVYVATILIVSF
jgi:hypothetical protein